MGRKRYPKCEADAAVKRSFKKPISFDFIRKIISFRKEFPSMSVNDAIAQIGDDSDMIRAAWRESGEYL